MKRQRLAPLCLTLTLALGACGKQEQASSAQTPAAPGAATSTECEAFEKNPLVVTRVDFKDPQVARNIIKTFEALAYDEKAGYLLLDVSKEDFERLRASGRKLGFTVSIDEERTAEQARLASGIHAQAISSQYPCFRTVEETYAAARQMTVDYPNLASWTAFGQTWLKQAGRGGYDLYVLKLTNKNRTGTKPKLVVTSAIHGREYAPAELMTRFAEYLVQNYGRNADVTWMLDTQEVHLVLQANPDGRKKAETGLLWRKNVNTLYCSTSSSKQGADLNRNFAFYWGQGGSSTNPCDETYRGPNAASEPEVQAVQTYLKSVFPDAKGPNLSDPAPSTTSGVYVDVHSYGRLLLWPWGFTSSVAPNGTAMQTLGRKLAYFNGHSPEQSIGLYPTSGTTIDYAYGELGVASFTYEVGDAFFESCTAFTSDILPRNQQSLLYALKVARAPYQLGAGPETYSVSAPSTVTSGTSFTLSATTNDARYNNSQGTEPSQAITAAEYYVDTPPWAGGAARAMSASDGAFSSTSEAVRAQVNTSGWSVGRHTLYVRGRDSSGNWGPVSAVFVTVQ